MFMPTPKPHWTETQVSLVSPGCPPLCSYEAHCPSLTLPSSQVPSPSLLVSTAFFFWGDPDGEVSLTSGLFTQGLRAFSRSLESLSFSYSLQALGFLCTSGGKKNNKENVLQVLGLI